jgi:hypothetical protein
MLSLDESNRISLKFKISEILFGDATGERRSPNAARTKHILQTFDPACFGGRFGDVAGNALT